MLSPRSWQVARRYALPPLALGCALAPWRRASALLSFGFAALLLGFFRDPERRLEPDPQLVYAPSDGVITRVGPADAPWVPFHDAICVSTFLSLHNVHVIRSPIPGKLIGREELDGGYLPALSASAARRNRQSRLSIRGPCVSIGLVLVAGALARRITPWVDIGEHLTPGKRLGLIHFGSRTDVVLPARGVEPLVRRGDRVRAGQTPIARIHGAVSS